MLAMFLNLIFTCLFFIFLCVTFFFFLNDNCKIQHMCPCSEGEHLRTHDSTAVQLSVLPDTDHVNLHLPRSVLHNVFLSKVSLLLEENNS